MKRLTKPGTYHWLSWPRTIWYILIFYGLYTMLSGTAIGTAMRHMKAHTSLTSSWVLLVILAVFTIFTMVLVTRWQQTTQHPHWKFGEWFKLYLGGAFGIGLLNIVSNLVFIVGFKAKTSGTNQSDLVNYFFTAGPVHVWTIMSTIVIAPFFEEFVFRYLLIGPEEVTIKRDDMIEPHTVPKFKQQLYCTVSVLIFMYLHIMDDVSSYLGGNISINSTISLIHLMVVYGGTGLILSYIYMKSQNIWYSASVHMTWNLISILPLLTMTIPHK